MIVLVSLIVLLRGLPCFHDFSHGASHPYISFLHLFHIFLVKRGCTHACMHSYIGWRTLRFNHVLV